MFRGLLSDNKRLYLLTEACQALVMQHLSFECCLISRIYLLLLFSFVLIIKHTHMHMHAHAHAHTCTCTHMHTHTQTNKHTNKQTNKHTQTNKQTNTHTHTNVNPHTQYIRMLTNAYMEIQLLATKNQTVGCLFDSKLQTH